MSNSQKLIGQGRAPRVHIEYDLEVYGETSSVELPFIMGVLADLSGKSNVPPSSIAERKFIEVDALTLDHRMASLAPRTVFAVDNVLTGEGKLPVDLVFSRMEDFAPAQIASQVPALAELLRAREQLSNLLTYMDGKMGAEDLIQQLLGNPQLLQNLAASEEAETPSSAATDADDRKGGQ